MFLSFAITSLSAQGIEISYPYSVFTIEDGLTQMQIRDIYIDSTGYVWIATQGGLNGYDGSNFHSYTNLGSVSEDYITRIFRGKDKIMGSAASGLFTYDGITSEVFRPKINDIYPQMGLLFEDSKAHIWVEVGGRFFILKEEELFPAGKVYPMFANIDIKYAWSSPSWSRIFLLDHQNRFYRFDPITDNVSVDSVTFNTTDIVKLPILGRTHKPSSIFFTKMEGEVPRSIYTIVDERLTLVAIHDHSTGKMVANSSFAPIGYDVREGNKSVMYFLQGSVYEPAHWLNIPHIRFCVNGEYKTYIGTDSGLYVVYRNGLRNFRISDCNYPWSVVPFDNDVLLAGCYSSGVHAFTSRGEYRNHYDFASPKMDAVFDAQILSNYLHENSITAFGSIRGFYFLREGKEVLENFYLDNAVEAFGYDKLNQKFIVGGNKVYIIDKKMSSILDSIEIPQELLFDTGITDIESIDGQNLWVATNFGIFYKDQRTGKEKIFQNALNNLPCQGAISFAKNEKESLWVGATCGLLRYESKKDVFIKILPDLINTRVNQIQQIPGEQLACVTNNELFILDVSTEPPTVKNVFGSNNGLYLLEPAENGISISNNRYLWMASSTGIQRLDLEQLPHSDNSPELKIISIGNELVKVQHLDRDKIKLKEKTALLKVSLTDHSGKNWLLRYALNNGSHSPWQSSREILVSGLKHGTNQLKLQALWTGSPLTPLIEKDYYLDNFIPFWQRRSTSRIIFASIFLIIAFFVSRDIRRRRKLNQLTTNLYFNRLRTIQAYLNPHFLFNALTSLQDYILQNDRKEGSKMVVSLSRILRRVLDFGNSDREDSKQNISLVHLSQEISFLNDYIFLENKQQNFPFQFEIEVDPEIIASDPMIPPLLIQPFVENAIKHAFKSNDQDKQIKVQINRSGQDLHIVIKDNGQGLKHSDKASKKSTSLGIKLARERMEILNKLGFANNINIKDSASGGVTIEIITTVIT
jgi:hypothetical protein